MEDLLSTMEENSTTSGSAQEDSHNSSNPQQPPMNMEFPPISQEDVRNYLDSQPGLREQLVNFQPMANEEFCQFDRN
ncbi:unnamed protein product [Caenorhabditis angaria]|uniref:Uncharacterized protein n=1 Tax=Caenorhabditis angaria TaxID=860376 RepID=A0A9P1MRU7_9PELO|nr:unnamed protein product [Caenorhabditis angaria]